jgi:hypothetical protein
MFKAIRKLVRQRSRDGHQGQSQVIEEDDSRSDSDVPPRVAEPQFEEPSGSAVQGKVKWFNPSNGYGFVQLSDGSGDAFLHATAHNIPRLTLSGSHNPHVAANRPRLSNPHSSSARHRRPHAGPRFPPLRLIRRTPSEPAELSREGQASYNP